MKLVSLRGLALELKKKGQNPTSIGTSLKLKKINVFAGPNGSGKSTVLDAVKFLFDPQVLTSLRRENAPQDAVPSLQIIFKNQKRIDVLLASSGESPDEPSSPSHLFQRTIIITAAGKIGFDKNLEIAKEIPLNELGLIRLVNESLEAKVHVWEESSRNKSISAKAYASILNKLSKNFPENEKASSFEEDNLDLQKNIKRKIFDIYEDKLRMGFADDPNSQSQLPIKNLPSGWQKIVELIEWIINIDKGAICVIDEPETHLHPTLQRALIQALKKIARRKNLQLIIATHSPVFINRRLWGKDEAAIFHMDKGFITPEPQITDLLDRLGFLSSDLFQSNGVIWVEGPSDRIYIKTLLNAWRAIYKENSCALEENFDYSFAFFNGSCLTHFSGQDNSKNIPTEKDLSQLISLLSLNRNMAICMDRDNDFVIDDFGTLVPINSSGDTKSRVGKELSAMQSKNKALVHLTAKYTIECYFAEVMRSAYYSNNSKDKFFLVTEKGGKISVRGNKVDHATKFEKLQPIQIIEIFDFHPEIKEFIISLDQAIRRWSRPSN